MLHEDITREVIGAAIKVHNELKPGLDEKLYEQALVIELRSRGRVIGQQKSFAVEYQNAPIGRLVPDLIVDDAVIVDTKVVTEFTDVHVAQMLGYLNITRLRVALLLNFKHASLKVRRVIR